MIELDHVIVAVRDLDAAAARLERDYGLTALPGGRHRGFGTGNRIVPLGSSYVELMAVVDEDEPSPLATWVTETSASGDRLGALCLRTDEIDAVAARLGIEAFPMSRTRPDGVELRWKLAGLEQTLADPGLPFFIQWDIAPEDFPGRAPAEHRAQPLGLRWVEIAQDRQVLSERVGDAGLDIRVVEGTHGVVAAGIATDAGEIVLR